MPFDTTTGFGAEGESLDEVTEGLKKETSTDSSTDTKPEEVKDEATEPSDSAAKADTTDEEKLPFHKHPRWKEMYERNKSLEEQIANLSSSVQKVQQPHTAPPIAEWFKDAYGDNQELWAKFSSYGASLKSEAKAEALAEMRANAQQEQAEVKRWESWVDESLTNLKAEGKQFDKNELLKVVYDYKPTDENGNIDFAKGYELLQLKQSKTIGEKAKARKQLADGTNSDNRGEAQPKDYVTGDDLRKMGGWRGMANL